LTASPYGKIYGKDFNLQYVYQSVFGEEGTRPRERSSDGRIKTILEADRVFNNSKILNSSICDVGSNLGHFSMSLEKAGCSANISGYDADKEFVSASNHIAKTINSKCKFFSSIVPAEVYLLLSVTHHMMLNNSYEGMRSLFREMDSLGAHTIYVEQATHLEWLEWASKLYCEGNPYIHFMKSLTSITDGKYNVRLIGVDRNPQLNTVRPIYQLKRKINKEIKIGNETYTAYDSWLVPYFGNRSKESAGEYYFVKDQNGEDLFLKFNILGVNKSLWSPPVPKVEGLLLSDIFRLGIAHFYDKDKIKDQLNYYFSSKEGSISDFRPWNVIVTENSTTYIFDNDESVFCNSDATTSKNICFLINVLLS
jgi:hypothetical protein